MSERDMTFPAAGGRDDRDADAGSPARRRSAADRFLRLLPGDEESIPRSPGLFRRVADALRWGEERLRRARITGARLQTTLLFGHAAGLDRAQVLARLREPVDLAVDARFRELIERRAAHVPLQYLRGTAPFLDFDVDVWPGVFIPRPETELVVERALSAWVAGRAARPDRSPDPAGTSRARMPGQLAVDVGTGSGIIAIALARRRPAARICAIDRSAEALRAARHNAVRLGVDDRVRLLHGDLLEPLGAGRGLVPEHVRRAVGIVVSNPPYGPLESLDVAPEVRQHEPQEAWAAGPVGTEIYERLIPQAADVLLPGRPLVLELGYEQDRTVVGLLRADGRWGKPRIERDFQEIPRVLTVLRAPDARFRAYA